MSEVKCALYLNYNYYSSTKGVILNTFMDILKAVDYTTAELDCTLFRNVDYIKYA